MSTLLLLLSVFATVSRGAILGIGIGFLFFFLWNLISNEKSVSHRGLKHSVIFAILFSFVCLFIQFFISEELLSIVVERLLNLSLESSGGRLDVWQANLKIFLDYPIFGVGLDSTLLYPEYYSAEAPVLMAHNLFLQVLVETGIIGFVVFLWIVWVPCNLIWRARYHYVHCTQRTLIQGLIIANLIILVQVQFLPILLDPLLWGMWAITAGVAMRLKHGLD